jgi:hypothetical protein
MAVKIKKLADLFMHGEAGVLTEFKSVSGRVIDAQLKTEEGRALLAAKLADAVKPLTPRWSASLPKVS